MSANPERVRVTVELDVASEPISGALHDGVGSVVEFVGWMELMSVLERACEQAPRPAPGRGAMGDHSNRRS